MRGIGRLLLLWMLGAALRGEAPFEALYRQTHPTFRVHAHRAPFPSDLVSALALDPDGCLWAGTVAGLAKYDGRGWQPVPMPLPAWRIWVNNNALGVLEDGTIWCGTRTEGLFLLRSGQWQRIGKEDGLPTSAVNCLLESRHRDASGRRILYVGTYGGGIARLKEGRWEVLDARQGLLAPQVFCLAEDPEGRLWAGTSGGVSILEGERFRPFEAQAALPHKEVRQLLWSPGEGGAPRLWLGPVQGGPCTWSEGKLIRHPIGTKGVSAIIPSRTGGVWVSFWGDGLARWEAGRWETWRKEDGLPSAQLRCLAEVVEDGRSILWIGSDGRGVFRAAEGGWRQFQPRWTGEVEVRAFLEGPDGAAWMAGRNFGLLRLDRRGWTRWDLPPQPITGDIRCLAWWRGQLWAGCDLEFLKLGPRGLEAGAPGTLLDRRITRCLLSTPDRLWIGTSVGLLSFDGQRAEAHPLPGVPGSISIRSLALGEAGLWVGTDGGLFRQDGDGFAQLPGFTPGEGILALRIDGRDLWIGTSAGRLLRWRDGSLTVLASGEGRWAIQGLQLIEGGHCLIASTTRGVECWDLATGQLRQQATMEDGLPDDTCLPGALFTDARGRVWVGTGGGAGVLDPKGAQPHPAPKPLRLVRAFGPSGSMAPGSLLPRGESWLQVDFALRAHHREEDTRYRTQLLPLEAAPGEWSAESHRRLQALPRGNYVLQVWAKDYHGDAVGPIAFPFRVRGRLWEHPAFLLSGSLLLLALGGLAARARATARERELVRAVAQATAQLSKQKAGLEELARQQQEIMAIVAHDVRNPLSGIGLMAEVLEEETDEAEHRRGLLRIREAVGSVTELLNQFLTLQAMEAGTVELHPERVDTTVLLEEVVETYRPQYANKRQELRLETCDASIHADPNILREILSNLVSNALKYSPKGAVVTVRTERRGPNFVRLSVQDEGPGLTEADKARLFQRFARLSARPTAGEPSVGLGLSLCKRWVEAMDGRIGAESEPGRGATFWVELKSAP